MKGHLILVSLGPGFQQYTAPAAMSALEECDIIAGYSRYVRLLPEHLQEKASIVSGMRGERQRCLDAVKTAVSGKKVALIASGDAGVYGLAGLAYELTETQLSESVRPVIEVIPGITAATSAAALLGAPLIHDFAVVSLSDLLTPWDLILKRLQAAASADFVLVLYNPRSKGRPYNLEEAKKVLLQHRLSSTPVGMVRNAYREQQDIRIETLETMDIIQVDMFTTVVVGNSQTRIIGGKMVTPRGYK